MGSQLNVKGLKLNEYAVIVHKLSTEGGITDIEIIENVITKYEDNNNDRQLCGNETYSQRGI